MSSQGYKNLVNPVDGKGLHWVTDVNAEIPVKLKPSGPGSEKPITVSEMFLAAVKKRGPNNALFVERNGKVVTWTWDQYWLDSMKFAKACHKIGCKERSSTAIMGFNSPEWTIAFQGSVMNNMVGTGIYITNAPEACFYQADHSEAEIVACETADQLKRFALDKLPRVKAFLLWGEKSIPEGCKDPRVYLWSDFLKLGADVKDNVIMEKINRQKPGECCCLIYTSGTTGNPKGCMLSHDNLTWTAIPMMNGVISFAPQLGTHEHRVVSYLPLSHIAGLMVDLISQFIGGHEVYFARPDALAGTLVQTLNWARPTIFFAVPRVWEKFEEKLKEIGASKPQFLQNISTWAKGHGSEKVRLQ
jgi:long-chain-fatty-acid--CoA ligase ACSBG